MRLAACHLVRLAAPVARPSYERTGLRAAFLHIGAGSFHRAHQAPCIDRMLAYGLADGGIVGVSMRRPVVRDALQPQDGLYTLITRGKTGENRQIIGSLLGILHGHEDLERIFLLFLSRQVRVVTLTVTRDGYLGRKDSREFDASADAAVHDLAHPGEPVSAIGVIVEGLRRRRIAGLPPLTFISCDDIAGNGDFLRRMVTGLAAGRDRELADWIEQENAFPDCLAVRMTAPAGIETRRANDAALGLRDAAPVVAEAHSEWIIEDRFAGPRPLFEVAGVRMVPAIDPFARKHDWLDEGGRLALSLLGCVAGINTVGECLKNPAFEGFLVSWVHEASGLLPGGGDFAPGAALETFHTRFANAAMPWYCWDGAKVASLSLERGLFSLVRARLDRGMPPSRLPPVVMAAWLRCIDGADDHGRPVASTDPAILGIEKAWARRGELPARISHLLASPGVGARDLAENADFVTAVAEAYRQMTPPGTAMAVLGKLAHTLAA